jgi:hypothetical protein
MAFVIGGTLRITSASKDLIFVPYVRSAHVAYFRCSKWPALKAYSGSCRHRNKCFFGIVALTECAAQRNSFVFQLLLSWEKNKSVWPYPGRKPNSHSRTFLSVIKNTLSKNRKLFILYFVFFLVLRRRLYTYYVVFVCAVWSFLLKFASVFWDKKSFFWALR